MWMLFDLNLLSGKISESPPISQTVSDDLSPILALVQTIQLSILTLKKELFLKLLLKFFIKRK